MSEFKNKLFEGIYYSRFIASYVKAGGKLYRREFVEWLTQLTINGKQMPVETAVEIYNLATNGKLELEENAKRYLANK